jgi:hypothetical protein
VNSPSMSAREAFSPSRRWCNQRSRNPSAL